jgi:hypothetical protein
MADLPSLLLLTNLSAVPAAPRSSPSRRGIGAPSPPQPNIMQTNPNVAGKIVKVKPKSSVPNRAAMLMIGHL